MVMMCPLGGVCLNSEMEEYESSHTMSTGSGDDGDVLTVKLGRCRSIKCPRLGESNKPDEKLEGGGPRTEEYSSIRPRGTFSI